MLKYFIVLAACITTVLSPTTVQAAEFYSGDTVTLDQEAALDNAYVAGQTIIIDAPVQNDLVVAGQNLVVNSDIEGNLVAAGSQITVNGSVGRNARLAGNTITIDGTIEQDLVVFAANLNITKTASINGDLVFNGGFLVVDGPVTGTVYMNSSQARINSTIGSLHAWQVNSLSLGTTAEVTSNLTYTSRRQATFERGAVIHGTIEHQESNARQIVSGINNAVFYYGLLTSLIFCLILLLLARRVVSLSLAKVQQNVLASLGIGIANLLFVPVIAVASLLFSLWLGLAIMLLYALLLILCIGLAQIAIGQWSLQWWFGRSKQSYALDWRAAIFGVLISTLLLYVPILGWFILFMALLLTLGGITQSLAKLR